MIALALVLARAAPAAAEQLAVPLFSDWCHAVATHTPGEPDDALALAARWTHADLERLRPIAEAIGGFETSGEAARNRQSDLDARARLVCDGLRAPGGAARFRVRALLLHTDVVTVSGRRPESVAAPVARHLKSQWEREEAERRVLLRADDGRAGGYELATLHWELAMGLLAVIRAEHPAHPLVPLWYRTVGAYLASESRFGEATPHFERARRVVPDDAGVLYGEACLQETLGSPRVQDVVRTTELPNGLRILDVAAPDVHLQRAALLLRRSLSQQPAFVDARIRLGRILTLQGLVAEARDVLAPLDAATGLTARQSFLVQMFTGDAALAAGTLADAVQAFERATHFFPQAQSARIALAHARRVSGDREAAREALRPSLEVRAATRGSDPWSSYYTGDAEHLEELWRALRATAADQR